MHGQEIWKYRKRIWDGVSIYVEECGEALGGGGGGGDYTYIYEAAVTIITERNYVGDTRGLSDLEFSISATGHTRREA